MFKQADLTQALQSIPWFVELTPSQIDRLAKIAHIRHLNAGDELFREGERDNLLYLLLEGQVVIETHIPSRGTVNIFTAEPLDVIGWSSLTPIVRQRTGSARATLSCRLIAFDGNALRTLCDEDTLIGYVVFRRLANVVASRLLTTRLQLFDVIVQLGHENGRPSSGC